jgi:aldose 1-epimerase
VSLVLESDRLRLEIDPAVGGSVLGFEALVGGVWLPILRPAQRPLARSSNASSFTLAPYSNRVRDGVFRFEGRTYPLRHPEKHAIHGDVRDRPWRVASRSREDVALEIRSSDFPDFNFPFPVVCASRFRLNGSALTMALRLGNAGSERMPAGCGFHPYFNRALRPGENVELEFHARGVYPGQTPLPTEPPVAVPPAQDFKRLRPFTIALDHCFSGWDGRAAIHWPQTGVTLRIEATPRFSHVILYSPPGAPFFALEPVTNANDGFNLLAAGQADTGVVVLEPGDALEAEVTLRVETDESGSSPQEPSSPSGDTARKVSST